MRSNRSDFAEVRRRLKQRLKDAKSRGSGRVEGNLSGRINKAVSINVGKPDASRFSSSRQEVRVRQDESGTYHEVHTEEIRED